MAWCGQCFTPVAGPALPPRTVAAEQRHLPTYTRWRKTTTTFGPVGRVLWTVAVALVMAVSVFSQNPFAIAPLCFILPPLVLRSVWAKGRLT
jgi:hypothetical protein